MEKIRFTVGMRSYITVARKSGEIEKIAVGSEEIGFNTVDVKEFNDGNPLGMSLACEIDGIVLEENKTSFKIKPDDRYEYDFVKIEEKYIIKMVNLSDL